MTTRNTFADNLASLPVADHLARIELVGPGGRLESIENQPGSQGSLRLYQHLVSIHGEITARAAELGLELFAEHVEDARNNPGKHPNIDRLIRVATDGEAWSARMVRRESE
jgi:hypothetical protein